MITTLHEMFRCFGAISLVGIGAIAVGELMIFVETTVIEFVREHRGRRS